MRPLFLGLVSVAILGCGLANLPLITQSPSVLEPTTFAERMNEFLNRDLKESKKPVYARLGKLLSECDPPIPSTDGESKFMVSSIWRYQNDNVNGFVIVRANYNGCVPGRSEVIVDVIDETGNQLTTSRFWTGWRHYLSRFRFFNDPKLDSEILEITTRNELWGPEVQQYYSVRPQHIGLIAIRDSDKKLVPNKYKADNWTIGPEVPWQTLSEWEQVLASSKTMDLLEALTWLGGIHRRDLSPSKDECLENLPSAQLYAQLRQNENIRNKIQELSQSKNLPVAEAAKLAHEQLLSDKDNDW